MLNAYFLWYYFSLVCHLWNRYVYSPVTVTFTAIAAGNNHDRNHSHNNIHTGIAFMVYRAIQHDCSVSVFIFTFYEITGCVILFHTLFFNCMSYYRLISFLMFLLFAKCFIMELEFLSNMPFSQRITWFLSIWWISTVHIKIHNLCTQLCLSRRCIDSDVHMHTHSLALPAVHTQIG